MLIRNRTVLPAAILMLLAGVQVQQSVTQFDDSVCAVTGSTVIIPCTIKDHDEITQKAWYRFHGSSGEPRDVSTDPQFLDRVSVETWGSDDCYLKVRNVRLSDSGLYKLVYKTLNSDWKPASDGFNLTVTDLKVTVSGSEFDHYKKLSCITTCRLSKSPSYIWYRNKQQDYSHYINELTVYYMDTDSYSCTVEGHDNLRSPAVCVNKQSCWSVTYSPQNLCSLIGSSVDIHSYFTFPDHQKFRKMEWFVKTQPYTEPVDVNEVKEYQGRVQYTQSSQNHSILTINNLRKNDAQTYRFRFYTNEDKYTGESGVSLLVTDLQVTGPHTEYYWRKKLSCRTTCILSKSPSYIWYRNGQQVPNEYRNELNVQRVDAGSYTCAVRGHDHLRSPAVCVFKQSCWSVTYYPQKICSLIGSSVNIHSYFISPDYHRVRKMFWFVKAQANTEPVDVKEVKEYQGRVQYTQISRNHCRLTINNLTANDAQTYRFRFYTNYADRPTSEPGVSLSLTDLTVTVSVLNTGYKKLSCITTCSLSYYPTYIWYRNGQQVPNEYRNELNVNSEDAGNYSCTVRGHEDLRSPTVYPPRNTTAVVLHSGDMVEGESVTLSCSSDANPPVSTYNWFKQTEAADTLLITGQNYIIMNISYKHRGLYYCSAHNQLGHHNSTRTHLNVLYTPKNTTAVVLHSGDMVEGQSVTLSCSSDANPPVFTYNWFKQTEAADTLLITGQNYIISNISSQHSGLYYCTAYNQLGHHNSTRTHLNVLYAPRNLSVTVVPSVSADSITLLCRSDSNPISSYTWYRKIKGRVIQIGNGTNLTFSSGEDGVHYCTARNALGSSNSKESVQTTGTDNRTGKYMASGIIVALFLMFIPVVLWMRKRAPVVRIKSEENSKNDSAPVYGNVSGEAQDDVQYSSVYFRASHPQEVALYSTVQLPKVLSQKEEVEYAAVSHVKSRAFREDEVYCNLSKE